MCPSEISPLKDLRGDKGVTSDGWIDVNVAYSCILERSLLFNDLRGVWWSKVLPERIWVPTGQVRAGLPRCGLWPVRSLTRSRHQKYRCCGPLSLVPNKRSQYTGKAETETASSKIRCRVDYRPLRRDKKVELLLLKQSRLQRGALSSDLGLRFDQNRRTLAQSTGTATRLGGTLGQTPLKDGISAGQGSD